MTTISAKVIAYSVAENTDLPIVTLELVYPRPIHSEFMTHRVFSRNASSSRAIPVKRMISTILDNMFVPIHWGANQPGMQAHHELTGWRRWASERIWRGLGRISCWGALALDKLGNHKQNVNRVVEPYSHIRVLVTSTEWDNFFKLRDHPDAEPHIQTLARAISYAIETFPRDQIRYLKPGQWHLPYVDYAEDTIEHPELLRSALMIATARAARVSYKTHDGKEPSVPADLELYAKLAAADPKHLSPLEHQATPTGDTEMHANFRGWRQFRSDVE